MKYLIWVIVAGLAILYPMAERLLPSSEMEGEIVAINDMIQDPLPHRIAVVSTKESQVEAVLYETNIKYEVGDKVILQNDSVFAGLYSVTDKVRTGALIKLFIVFLATILIVSGTSGMRSILGLVFSFAVIFKFVLPQILLGGNPVTVALMASVLILSVSYYLTHGINHKSTIAILGTLGALGVTGILATVFASSASLSGFGSEEAGFLIDKLPVASFYSLLLAGIIIGSLGVLDDITISQASIVQELSQANHKLGPGELYLRAMRIGHDHISSLVNTLVLVYAGSALPLLLLFVTSESSFVQLLNYEALAEEVVRTLVGSIGLVSAVPLTTLIASFWYGGKKN